MRPCQGRDRGFESRRDRHFPVANKKNSAYNAEFFLFLFLQGFFRGVDHFIIIWFLTKNRHIFDVSELAIAPNDKDRTTQITTFLYQQTAFDPKISFEDV